MPDDVRSDADATEAEAQLLVASEAAATSTQFVLVAVLLALVLFFASIALKFTHPRAQVLLSSVAVLLLVVSVVRVALLPHAF